MMNTISYQEARDLLMRTARPADLEEVPLQQAAGRILGRDLTAGENVPAFDKSPYDGYAFRAADTAEAGPDHPVTLRVLEEVPAGRMPRERVTAGTAVRIMTGAPIPEGADAVCMFEKTDFTGTRVTLFSSFRSGQNVIRAGEDVGKGTLLARQGTRIDAGLCGSAAAQNRTGLLCYRIPRVGLLSTGSELLEVGEASVPGRIYNSNRYTFAAELSRMGFDVRWLGTAPDSVDEIRALLEEGLRTCDAVLSTGGVSVGDYDVTAKAMEEAGAGILFRGVSMKPGMACAYGVREGKLVCGLSGNPASSLINFHVIAAPAFRRIAGWAADRTLPSPFPVALAEGFGKPSPLPRFLRGRLDLSDGGTRMRLSPDQGNIVLSSSIGMDMIALVPAGSGRLEAGTMLEGFLI